MQECTRNLFMVNDELRDVTEFEQFFLPRKSYVYEVFRVIRGVPLFIGDHLDRLNQTILLSGVESGIKDDRLLAGIRSVIQANGPEEGNIKIALVPGKDGIRNLLIYYTPHLYPTALQIEKGVRVKLLSAERVNPNAKVMDISLRAETDKIKSDDEVYEVLLVDRHGCITEGSRSNVFFIRTGEVITPPLEAVLPGVTRKQIIGLCRRNGIKISESPVHRSRLSDFNALFISGTSRKVLPVNRVDDFAFKVNDPLLRRIEALFEQHVLHYLQNIIQS